MKTYDLIILFDKKSFVNIKEDEYINSLANWSKYGKYGFRGFCQLSKDEMENIIFSTFHLSTKCFSILTPSSLYFHH